MVCDRFVVPWHICGGPAGNAQGALYRPCTTATNKTFLNWRRTIPSSFSVVRKYFFRMARPSAGPRGILQFFQVDAQRYTKSNGRDGLLSVRTALRSSRVRNAHPERLLGGVR